jgi:hypothetical protein
VHVTTVVPTGNVLPDAGLHTAAGGGVTHPPLTVAFGYVTVAPLEEVAEAVMFAGHASVSGGGILGPNATPRKTLFGPEFARDKALDAAPVSTITIRRFCDAKASDVVA